MGDLIMILTATNDENVNGWVCAVPVVISMSDNARQRTSYTYVCDYFIECKRRLVKAHDKGLRTPQIGHRIGHFQVQTTPRTVCIIPNACNTNFSRRICFSTEVPALRFYNTFTLHGILSRH